VLHLLPLQPLLPRQPRPPLLLRPQLQHRKLKLLLRQPLRLLPQPITARKSTQALLFVSWLASSASS
jgi:hypothetical protein